jgi:hypothetical protein
MGGREQGAQHNSIELYIIIDASPYFGPEGGLQFEGYPLPASKLRFSLSRCAPVATNPEVYCGTLRRPRGRVSGVGGYHIGSLYNPPHTICAPVVPLLDAFCDPQ